MRDGDIAGLCALQDRWAFAGLVRKAGELFVTLRVRNENSPADGVEVERIPVSGDRVRLGVWFDFECMKDKATFYLQQNGAWRELGQDTAIR